MTQMILTLFTLGAVFGTLGDFLHVISNTDGYLDPYLPLPGGQPIWVPLLFGTAAVSIGMNHFFLTPPKKIRSLKFIAWGGAAFLALYAASGFLPFQTGGLKDILLVIGCSTTWYFLDRTLTGLLLGLWIALIGVLIEIGLVHQGAFQYSAENMNFYGVPTWLPWLYISGSIVVGNMSKWLQSKL